MMRIEPILRTDYPYDATGKFVLVKGMAIKRYYRKPEQRIVGQLEWTNCGPQMAVFDTVEAAAAELAEIKKRNKP